MRPGRPVRWGESGRSWWPASKDPRHAANVLPVAPSVHPVAPGAAASCDPFARRLDAAPAPLHHGPG